MPLRNALPRQYYAEAGPSGYNTNKALPPKPRRKTFAEQAGNDPNLQGLGWLLNEDDRHRPATSSSRSTRSTRSTQRSAPQPHSWLDPPSPTYWPSANPPRKEFHDWRGEPLTHPKPTKQKHSRGKPLPAAPDKPLPPAPWDTDYPYTRPHQSGRSTHGHTLKHKQKFDSRPIELETRQPRLVPYGSQRASERPQPRPKLEPLKHGFVKGEIIETRGDRLRAASGKRPKTMLKSEWEAERRRKAELERARSRKGSACCVVQ
ncbi:hypothetical protein MBLNU230_g8392t1 [Neophaeotheca triangularis]